MMDQRKPLGRSATGLDSGNGRFVTVGPPAPYEGVGRALRATYAPARDNLPQDMMALLACLDRR
ncbi:MAG: hypothetical protein I8H96_09905 [Sphingomonadaceae bacterium]|nr:hypothetical protein [Sphingomonadaceae bacterium]